MYHSYKNSTQSSLSHILIIGYISFSMILSCISIPYNNSPFLSQPIVPKFKLTLTSTTSPYLSPPVLQTECLCFVEYILPLKMLRAAFRGLPVNPLTWISYLEQTPIIILPLRVLSIFMAKWCMP